MQSWSPIGQSDIIIESEKRAHLSSIGLVSISPIRHNMQFFTSTFPGSAKSAEMSCVLDELHKYFRRKVLIVWDNLQDHKGLQAKYEREHPDGVHFERLPTYSPELNVVEQCWNYVKNVAMPNFVAKNQKQFIKQVELATKNINETKIVLESRSKQLFYWNESFVWIKFMLNFVPERNYHGTSSKTEIETS